MAGGRVMANELNPCGTRAAYLRHLNHGELACDVCLAATAKYNRDRRAKNGYVRGPYGNNECGTYAGYQRHQRRGEVTCKACCAAAAKYRRELRQRFSEQAAA